MATVRRKALWDAIHQYAEAVGGDPAKGIYGAIVAVEQAVDSELAAHSAHSAQLFSDMCKQIRGLERDKAELLERAEKAEAELAAARAALQEMVDHVKLTGHALGGRILRLGQGHGESDD